MPVRLNGFTCEYHFARRAINVPTAIPDENPNANIAIFAGEETSPQSVTDEAVAMIRNSSAVATNALFDFILIAP
jgi:hypothetical protein